MAILDVYLNEYLVGEFKTSGNGAAPFQYNKAGLNLKRSRPISFSMPLSKQ